MDQPNRDSLTMNPSHFRSCVLPRRLGLRPLRPRSRCTNQLLIRIIVRKTKQTYKVRNQRENLSLAAIGFSFPQMQFQSTGASVSAYINEACIWGRRFQHYSFIFSSSLQFHLHQGIGRFYYCCKFKISNQLMIILDFVRDAGLMTLTMTKLADDYGISQNVFGMVRQRLCSLDSSIYLK